MSKQLIFSIVFLISLAIFAYSIRRIYLFFKITGPSYPIQNIRQRIALSFKVAFFQSKIFRMPFIGLVHALVFWGFLVITIGSAEIIIDGLTGTERFLSGLGVIYSIIMISGDVFAYLVAIGIVVFLVRRGFMNIKRFNGIELKKKSKLDAGTALVMILLLMLSLIGMNILYPLTEKSLVVEFYPISKFFVTIFENLSTDRIHNLYEICWWTHILLIFFFANYLPYSKHFHVFASIPNVFLSNLKPLGYLPNIGSITNEVKILMDPEKAFASGSNEVLSRFGVKDIEDVSWKNYLDSLTCTECGRCTAVCPANITGKKLSPRKIFVDLRARMKEKGPGILKNGKEYNDSKSLVKDLISHEELWACTTCNACAMECPLNISHPNLIVDMRRYLVMEEAAAPAGLNSMFTNIENNGAPWQYSPEDRLNWTEEK